MAKPVKFTRGSGCLACDESLVNFKGHHTLTYILAIVLLLGTVLHCTTWFVWGISSLELIRVNFSITCRMISCSAERSFSGLRRLKTYLRNKGQQRVSDIAPFNMEREYANSVVNNDMDRTLDIFGGRNGRDSYFF